MMFIGFGFLMTFLHKYGFSAVGYNFLLTAFVIQWSILVHGFFEGAWKEFKPDCSPIGDELASANAEKVRYCIPIGITKLIGADFSAATVLISFGALLGKTNPTQLLIVAIFEIIFMAINEKIAFNDFSAVDVGGSMVVHTFGAYFGLAVSWIISSSKDGAVGCSGQIAIRERNSSRYNTDLFSMIGTVFLWMFWPSFNGALAEDEAQFRVVINTVLALSACCVTAFVVDSLLRPEHKFNMVSIQNATLAGGVAVGASADLLIQPFGAILIGMVGGAISVLGYVTIQPCLAGFGLDDTCGVHNLHGMPGVFASIASAFASLAATDELYGKSVGMFQARAVDGRSRGDQFWYQLLTLVVTLIISIVGGVFTGIIIKLRVFQYSGKLKSGGAAIRNPLCNFCHSSDSRTWYDDSYYWDVPEKEEEEEETSTSSEESTEEP